MRAFSNTFAGIRPIDLPGFIAAQTLGALLVAGWMLAYPEPAPHTANKLKRAE